MPVRRQPERTAVTSDYHSPAVYWVFGLPFDAVDLSGAARFLLERADRGQRVVFATPNLNFLRTSQENPVFLRHVLNTELSLVDGMPLVWLGRLAGVPFRERAAGSSLVDYLVQRPAAPAETGPRVGLADRPRATLGAALFPGRDLPARADTAGAAAGIARRAPSC